MSTEGSSPRLFAHTELFALRPMLARCVQHAFPSSGGMQLNECKQKTIVAHEAKMQPIVFVAFSKPASEAAHNGLGAASSDVR
jgi:hypothetical protein